MSPQLTLALKLADHASFDNYIVGQNAGLLAAMESAPFVYVHGDAGCGKSHLLTAWVKQRQSLGETALYVPLQQWYGFGADSLQDLQQADCIAFDDIQAVYEDPEWIPQIMGCLDALRAAGKAVVVSGRLPPYECPTVADLQSRLNWGLSYFIEPLNDVDKQKVIQQRASRRGMTIPDEVAHFILKRTSRHLGDLMALLEQIEQASLIQKRRVTIPLVKELLPEPPSHTESSA